MTSPSTPTPRRFRAHAIDGDGIQEVPHVTWMYLVSEADAYHDAYKIRIQGLLRQAKEALKPYAKTYFGTATDLAAADAIAAIDEELKG